MSRKVFSITGVHGSGKTTIYNSLRALHRKEADWVFMPERAGRSPYPFGSRDVQIAFRAELWYLRKMLERNKIIQRHVGPNRVIVCDRSPVCVLAYSYALCSVDDYRAIRDLCFTADWEEDATFYLEMTLESALARLTSGRRKNLKKWNEGEETYIKSVLEGYEKAFNEVKRNRAIDLIRIPNHIKEPREAIQTINNEIIVRR